MSSFPEPWRSRTVMPSWLGGLRVLPPMKTHVFSFTAYKYWSHSHLFKGLSHNQHRETLCRLINFTLRNKKLSNSQLLYTRMIYSNKLGLLQQCLAPHPTVHPLIRQRKHALGSQDTPGLKSPTSLEKQWTVISTSEMLSSHHSRDGLVSNFDPAAGWSSPFLRCLDSLG